MTKQLQNFGRNLELRPAAYYEPQNEREVLEILDRHRGEQLRAIGSLHSWSDAAECLSVVINMRHFGHVDVETVGDASWAVVVGGRARGRPMALFYLAAEPRW
jgi:FAD/FMN-containing dehydrogenase